MKMFVKLFIYLAIIVIIAVLNNAGLTHAKSFGGINNLSKMEDPPEKLPEFESSVSRMRRAVEPRAADESDLPKEQLYEGSRLRTRRQAPPGESDVPQITRAKRQMPSPPGEMPMPPM